MGMAASKDCGQDQESKVRPQCRVKTAASGGAHGDTANGTPRVQSSQPSKATHPQAWMAVECQGEPVAEHSFSKQLCEHDPDVIAGSRAAAKLVEPV